ncbi:ABC transporter permease [Niabella sp.]|uniref:ABC transporter permease n=1 Tax=Niabella sp. TaxID=1962976 RepID=UPI00260F28FF|nr:ABC transporter permease [Niabella sp.]
MSTLATIIKREWKRIFTLPAHYVVLLVIPPVVFLFFGFIYNKKFAEDMPVMVWDEDQSALSTKLTDMLNATASIRITGIAASEQQVQTAIRSGNIFGAVHFPRNMEADLKSNHPTAVTVYTNAAAIVPAKLIYKDAAGVIIKGGLAVVLQKFTKQGMPERRAMALLQPIQLNTVTLYNPDYNYQQYLTPGLITVGLQMALILVGVLLLNYEAKTGTFNELVQTAKGSASQIVIGKTIAHLTIAWLNFILIAGIVFPVYGLSKPGTFWSFFILFSLLSLACIGIGLMVSAIVADVITATDVALFYTSPAFVFSGFTFPRWAMPWYDQFYAGLMPYTPFLDGFIKVYYMQLPLGYAQRECGLLLIFIAVSLLVAILMLQRKINKTVSP